MKKKGRNGRIECNETADEKENKKKIGMKIISLDGEILT